MKLSICIPTYNRSFYVDRLLKCIYEQIEKGGYEHEVEVLVSDNCSTDNTQDALLKYHSRGLKYTKQSENIGPDRNFFSLFSNFKGEYIWLLGDDDLIADNALDILLSHLSEGELDYLYLRNKFKHVDNDIYLNGKELFEKVLVNTTFMSSQLIRGELVRRNIEESKAYFGNLMAYFYLFLKCLYASNKCLIPKERIVFMEEDNTGGYNLYKVWGKGVFDVLYSSDFKNSRALINKFKVDMFYTILIPMTYKARFSKTKLRFDSSDKKEIELVMSVYFSGFFEKKFLNMYLSCSKFILFPVLFSTRVINKIRRIHNETVF